MYVPPEDHSLILYNSAIKPHSVKLCFFKKENPFHVVTRTTKIKSKTR